MENVSCSRPTNTPVFITFTPEKAKELGLDNSIDRMPSQNKFERIPDCDCFGTPKELGAPVMAMKMPSPAQVTAAIALLPVILENGKKSIIAIFDICDILSDRMGKKPEEGEHQLQAVVLPDELVNAIKS